MTSGLVTIGSQPRRQIGIQVKTALERPVNVGMANDAIVPGPTVAVGGIVVVTRRRNVALATQVAARLLEQAFVIRSVGSVAFQASPALNVVGVDGGMFVHIRSGLFGMAIAAYSGPFVDGVVVGPLDETMATEAGQRPLQYGVIGHTREVVGFFIVALEAEFGSVIDQQGMVVVVDLVAGITIQFLFGMGVEAVTIEINVSDMALSAGFCRLAPFQVGGIDYILGIRIVHMLCGSGVTAFAGDPDGRPLNLRRQTMGTVDQGLIEPFVAHQAGFVIDRFGGKTGRSAKQDKYYIN